MICCGLDLKYWDYIKDELQRAFIGEVQRTDIDKLKQQIESKECQLWAAHENGHIKSILVTNINVYHNLKAVNIMFITGTELDSWFDVACETIGNWGKEKGCSVMEATGRLGWSRYLDKKGFVDKRMTMAKVL